MLLLSFGCHLVFLLRSLIYLAQLIAAQKARQSEELQRPFGSNFLSFFRASKPEIINIFFAFVCVLLAYQLHAMRAGIRKLQTDAGEKDEEIVRLRSILADLVSENESGEGNNHVHHNTFSTRLATKCAEVVKNIFYESEKRVGYSWILGKKLASGDAMEVENLVDQLKPVILSEMQSNVGDAAFTPDEIKERRVAALKILKPESLTVQQELQTLQSNGGKQNVQLNDLMEILEEDPKSNILDMQNAASDENGKNAILRRTRYAI